MFTFDISKLLFEFGNIPLTGALSTDSPIAVAFDEDIATDEVSVNGTPTRSMSVNSGATITATFQATAPELTELGAILAQDINPETRGSGLRKLLLRDVNSEGWEIYCEAAYISSRGNRDIGTGNNTIQMTFRCGKTAYNLRGYRPLGS